MNEHQSEKPASLPVHAPNHKRFFNSPGYLFWKIQSHLTKLANRLLHNKLIKQVHQASKKPKHPNR